MTHVKEGDCQVNLLGAVADQVGVCALQCHGRGVAAQDAGDRGRERGHARDEGQRGGRNRHLETKSLQIVNNRISVVHKSTSTLHVRKN